MGSYNDKKDNDMQIKTDIEFSKEEVINLYEEAGWTAYTKNKDKLWQSITSSLKIYSIFVDNEFTAIARVLGDGITTILIQDIIVKQKYQNRGIGTALIKAILKDYKSVRQTILLCDNDKKLIDFYKKNGLKNIEDYNISCYGILK